VLSLLYSLLRKGYVCCSRTDWPLKLVVTVVPEGTSYRYVPRSDFHVSFDRMVYLMVEVQSEKDENDRYRMLLQAACVARLGRNMRSAHGGGDDLFIVMALYIEGSGRVTRYLVFQHDTDPTVSVWIRSR
jgi:hypothetical protein